VSGIVSKKLIAPLLVKRWAAVRKTFNFCVSCREDGDQDAMDTKKFAGEDEDSTKGKVFWLGTRCVNVSE
jgi:hypothetical protein